MSTTKTKTPIEAAQAKIDAIKQEIADARKAIEDAEQHVTDAERAADPDQVDLVLDAEREVERARRRSDLVGKGLYAAQDQLARAKADERAEIEARARKEHVEIASEIAETFQRLRSLFDAAAELSDDARRSIIRLGGSTRNASGWTLGGVRMSPDLSEQVVQWEQVRYFEDQLKRVRGS